MAAIRRREFLKQFLSHWLAILI